MNEILFNYFIIKIISIAFIGCSYYLYYKRKLHKYFFIAITIISSLILADDIFNNPSLKSNAQAFFALKNLNVDNLEKITINDSYFIEDKNKLEKIINLLKLNRENKYNHPIYSTEYELILFLKNKEKLILKVVKVKNQPTEVRLYNKFNNRLAEVAVYQNDLIFEEIELLISDR